MSDPQAPDAAASAPVPPVPPMPLAACRTGRRTGRTSWTGRTARRSWCSGNSLGTSAAVWDRQVPRTPGALPAAAVRASRPRRLGRRRLARTRSRPWRRRARAAGLARPGARRLLRDLARRHDRHVAGGARARAGSPRSAWSARPPYLPPADGWQSRADQVRAAGMASVSGRGDQPLVHARPTRPAGAVGHRLRSAPAWSRPTRKAMRAAARPSPEWTCGRACPP